LSWIDDNGDNQTCASAGSCGSGGFAPFGFNGIIGGAAKCFYAFIGFDCIATTGEEVKNPKTTIPLSIIITLSVVALSYMASSAVLTFMVPYYMLDPNVPVTQAFAYVGLNWAYYVVAIGAIASLATCLYASMFPMPRVVYSMASDGLIFKWLAWVAPKLKTPAAAALFTGIFSAVLVLVFDLNQLINMMSIGTLLAYSLVSACALVLRYRPSSDDDRAVSLDSASSDPNSLINAFREPKENIIKRLLNPNNRECNKDSANLVCILTVIAGKNSFS
jgi:amino acid transporter